MISLTAIAARKRWISALILSSFFWFVAAAAFHIHHEGHGKSGVEFRLQGDEASHDDLAGKSCPICLYSYSFAACLEEASALPKLERQLCPVATPISAGPLSSLSSPCSLRGPPSGMNLFA